MNHEEFQNRLYLLLGDKVPIKTLKHWGYTGIIDPPTRVTHGKGSGKKGRDVSWSDDAVYDAAAVWAIRHSPRIPIRPSNTLIGYLKRSAWRVYNEPLAFFLYSGDLFDPSKRVPATYRSIKVQLPYHDYKDYEQQPNRDVWEVLLITWIAAREKARRGIPIKEPRQVIFHWRTVNVEKGNDYALDAVTVEPVSDNEDEIVIFKDGVDERERFFLLLSRVPE